MSDRSPKNKQVKSPKVKMSPMQMSTKSPKKDAQSGDHLAALNTSSIFTNAPSPSRMPRPIGVVSPTPQAANKDGRKVSILT